MSDRTQFRIQIPETLFEGSEAFISLLLRQGIRAENVAARAYANGSWNQYSGRDLLAHIGRASADWTHTKSLLDSKELNTILYLGTPSYVGWIAALGAVCSGLDVMFLPSQASLAELKWSVQQFSTGALLTDSDEFVPFLKSIDLPLYHVGTKVFLPRDRHPDPEVFSLFRLLSLEADLRVAREIADGAHLRKIALQFNNRKLGRFHFVSFGHDGEQMPVTLPLDALVLTAQNFALHLGAPFSLHWRSMEMLGVSTAFCHVGRFATLQKNGVLGFCSATSDWETNLRILRPSLIFGSSLELDQVVSFVESVTERPRFKGRLQVGGTLEKLREMLSSGRALKLPEKLFDTAGRTLRYVSRKAVGHRFLEEALGSLQLFVHGLAPAKEANVRCLERLGVPVVETYGVTAAAGVLSSNTFESPHLNLVGSPLPHVSFRLGALSLLEYRLNLPCFGPQKEWQETGDVAQMTPFGFSITGRKKHLYKTRGGAVVSPVRIEQAFRGEEPIEDACLVGDLMPYLVLLVVPSAHSLNDLDEPVLRDKIQDQINKVNESLPRNVTIKKFALLNRPFSEQEGEKLPNGSLNRHRIFESRKTDIQSLYETA